MNIYRKSDIPEHFCQYFEPAELGLEKTPEEYVEKIVIVFREVRRVLKDDGTLWLNLGDSYSGGGSGMQNGKTLATPISTNGQWGHIKTSRNPKDIGLKPKDLIGIPWLVAFALRKDGWYLRSDIIWSKPNPMPESVTDRPTKAHEYLFLMSKNTKYYYNADAIKEKANGNSHSKGKKLSPPIESAGIGHKDWHKYTPDILPFRNKRSVWTIATQPYPEAHFATFPEKLVLPCILAGSKQGDIVLDPFGGSGTVGLVSKGNERRYILIELNQDYCSLAVDRLRQEELF